MRQELSERELQVLEYAVKGHTDDMIARAMGIEKGTVNSYWVRIRGKLGHLSRTHLVSNYLQERIEQARAEHKPANQADADALVVHNSNVLERERRAHQEQIDEMRHEADGAAKDHKEALDKALEEIERLRALLKKRSK